MVDLEMESNLTGAKFATTRSSIGQAQVQETEFSGPFQRETDRQFLSISFNASRK
jgi:hypothetical protein